MFWTKTRNQLMALCETANQQTRSVARWGAWLAQSVERPTSGQVMISQFVGSSPTSGSILTEKGLLWILCLSVSLSLSLSASPSPSKPNK